MNVDLDKEDLRRLVKGIVPHYSAMNDPRIKVLGTYTGGFVDKWFWNDDVLKKLTEKGLWKLYNLCKNSWKDE